MYFTRYSTFPYKSHETFIWRLTCLKFRLVAIIQIILGLAYLFVPDLLLKTVAHSIPPQDIHYPLAMLAARFLAYGAGLWIAADHIVENRMWIRLMAVIQLIDLGQGAITR